VHSALIVVEVPDNKKKWRAFIDDIDRPEAPLHKTSGVERLSKNIWLVNFRENPEPLARLISAAAQHLFPYRILQFDAEPEWVLGPHQTLDEGDESEKWQPPDDPD
jgi:hypothetical protein